LAKRSVLRRAGWGLLAALGTVMVSSAIGWRWERSEQRAFIDLGRSPPGEIIRLGTQNLHVVAEGTGSLGVLFISGGGDDWRTWREIAARLADSVRVVSYDRPGLGWSPPRESPLTLEAAVEDIRRLLEDTGLFQQPPVLVGHSFGGAIARQFAIEHPQAVGGLVLIDPTPLHALPRSLRVALRVAYRGAYLSSAIGLTRRMHYRNGRQLSREQRLYSAFLNADATKARETLREVQGAFRSKPRLGGDSVLGNVPLTVLCATLEEVPGLKGALAAAHDARRQIAQESTRGRLVEVNTGHYVHYEDPDTVVAEVSSMLAVIRQDLGPD
jgi:pimeloyl-ACP methyl ester carboxylesterase